MKKKLLFLFVGALALAQVSFAQPVAGTPVVINVPGTGASNVFVTGIVNGVAVNNVQLGAQAAVSMGSIFTVNGQQYAILPATQPNAFNPLQNGLFDFFVVVDLNGNGVNNVNYASLGGTPIYNGDQVFGTQTGNFTVVAIPFDFGTSAVLGFGLLAAFVAARNRRKQFSMLA